MVELMKDLVLPTRKDVGSSSVKTVHVKAPSVVYRAGAGRVRRGQRAGDHAAAVAVLNLRVQSVHKARFLPPRASETVAFGAEAREPIQSGNGSQLSLKFGATSVLRPPSRPATIFVWSPKKNTRNLMVGI